MCTAVRVCLSLCHAGYLHNRTQRASTSWKECDTQWELQFCELSMLTLLIFYYLSDAGIELRNFLKFLPDSGEDQVSEGKHQSSQPGSSAIWSWCFGELAWIESSAFSQTVPIYYSWPLTAPDIPAILISLSYKSHPQARHHIKLYFSWHIYYGEKYLLKFVKHYPH